MDAELRYRQRNRYEAGLHCAEEGDDVLKSLRRQYGGPITSRAANCKLFGDGLRSLMDLSPREGFGKALRVNLVIDEGVCDGIALGARSLLQQRRERRFGHGEPFTSNYLRSR